MSLCVEINIRAFVTPKIPNGSRYVMKELFHELEISSEHTFLLLTGKTQLGYNNRSRSTKYKYQYRNINSKSFEKRKTQKEDNYSGPDHQRHEPDEDTFDQATLDSLLLFNRR